MALPMRKNQSRPVHNDCPLSSCMAILGGVWTPEIIWNLHGGARRFSELQNDIPMVSAKVLSSRLRKLVTKKVINRVVKPTSPPSVEYSLTDLGEELIPVIDAIVKVGHKIKLRNEAERMVTD